MIPIVTFLAPFFLINLPSKIIHNPKMASHEVNNPSQHLEAPTQIYTTPRYHPTPTSISVIINEHSMYIEHGKHRPFPPHLAIIIWESQPNS